MSKILLSLVLVVISAHAQAITSLRALASNPLLRGGVLPRYAEIKPQHVEQAVRQLVSLTEEKIAAIEQDEATDFDSLFRALAEIDIYFSRIWLPLANLHLVNNYDEFRVAHYAAVPAVTALKLQLAQNRAVYHKLLMSTKQVGLDAVQQRMVQLHLAQMRTLGVELSGRAQQFFNDLSIELAQLEIQFGNNTIKAREDFRLILHEHSEVVGLPTRVLQQAAAKYQHAIGKPATATAGPWLITLDYPSYEAFMEYSERRDLRRQLHHAHSTLATQAPYDNTPVLQRILQLRLEKARLLDFPEHAALRFSAKMADNASDVQAVLDGLHDLTQQQDTEEGQLLNNYIAQHSQSEELEDGDMYWWSRKAREDQLGISIEELRQYFPLPRVLDGLFTLLHKLFGISIKENTDNVQVWHPDVKFYDVHDTDGTHIASFYFDPYSRPQNKSHLQEVITCNSRHLHGSSVEIPVCNIAMSISPPTGDKPALLSMYEVTILFHEFGHVLHELLTTVNYGEVAGRRGVELDAIEMPSALLEKFIYLDEVMPLISAQVESGEPLPAEIQARLRHASDVDNISRHALFLSYLDLRLHTDINPYTQAPIALYRQLYEQVMGSPPYEQDYFINTFAHIFYSYYDTNYYSYVWSKILAADIFATLFKANGFDAEGLRRSGRKYRDTLLAASGSKSMPDIFIALLGRLPSAQAFLQKYEVLGEE